MLEADEQPFHGIALEGELIVLAAVAGAFAAAMSRA